MARPHSAPCQTTARPRSIGRLVVALVLIAVSAGCRATSSPSAAAENLAEALHAGDVAALAGDDAQAEWRVITRGMDGLTPEVTVTGVQQDGDTAEATLGYEWTIGGQSWAYETTAPLVQSHGEWKPAWQPSIIHPRLSATTRLVHRVSWPRRADITDDQGNPLMTYRPVQRIGINKPDTTPDQWRDSARELAKRLKINPAQYEAKVRAAGREAFVEALVVRGSRKPQVISGISGAKALADEAVLAPTRSFAVGVLGTVAPATAEQVASSNGKLVPGSLTGQSGLQARYDSQLRGTPGEQIVLRGRESGSSDQLLFSVDARPGAPLRTTLSLASQGFAEKILATQKSAAALVAINPSNGHVVAAATGPKNRTTSDATFGRYAPGSTFKAVTSLALLRSGMTPDSMVDCTTHVTVDGRRFKNYNDFPAARVGRMTMRDAIALSCNTALIAEHGRIDGAALRDAAASLGLGQDMDLGLPAFLGSVPDPVSTVGLAESMIGQGLVEASPMAMATVAASIQAGHTVRPVVLPGHDTREPESMPLTDGEAAQLRDMLHAVVVGGSGAFLAGEAEGAKTGTAEYGTERPPRTHAWMIANNPDIAVAVMVYDGQSGSGSAGPLIKAFLQ